jgi:uncharacterized protein (DUF2062 family)
MAVGLFCGLVPGPLQMLSAALLAIVFKVNLPVAVATTWYTNPITIVPLYYLAYRLGLLVTGESPDGMPGAQLDLRFNNIGDWIPTLTGWITAMGKPFVIGLVLLALILAATGYFAVLAAWRIYITAAWQQRRRQRIKAEDER